MTPDKKIYKTVLIVEKLAPKFGLVLKLEPRFKNAGQLINKYGKVFYIKNTSFDINGFAAAEVARDKAYTSYFLKEAGFNVPREDIFFSDYWCGVNGTNNDLVSAISYANELGFPLFVKPNSKAQGEGVFKIHNKKQLKKILKILFKDNNVLLLQGVLGGNDYRVVVFNGEVFVAYKRFPLAVVGDGNKNIEKLLEEKIQFLNERGQQIKIKVEDRRITERLKTAYGFDKNSIPDKEQTLLLLDNANLSSGGGAIDVLDELHPSFKEFAVRVAKESGLLFAGIDIITKKEPNECLSSDDATVLEVNSSPGLSNFMEFGTKQKEQVMELYSAILNYLTEMNRGSGTLPPA